MSCTIDCLGVFSNNINEIEHLIQFFYMTVHVRMNIYSGVGVDVSGGGGGGGSGGGHGGGAEACT